jgi:hypothetical protein
MERVFSAPNAVILVDGKVAGFITNISVTETYNRSTVKGLGDVFDKQVPVVGASGSWNASQFFIDFSTQGAKSWLNRVAGSAENLVNTLSLGQFPFTIAMYEKEVTSTDADARLVTGINPTGKRKLLVRDCYLDSQSFSISNDSVSTLNVSGRYLSPISFSN